MIKLLAKKLLHRAGWVKVQELKSNTSESLNYPIYSHFAIDVATLETKGRLMLPSLLPTTAVGLELGVAAGYFSDALLHHQNISELYAIDAWADHHDANEYLHATSILSKHGQRAHLLRGFFDQFIDIFPDEFFDFIYFDAYAHTGQNDGLLLSQWYPKIRKGGLCAGHDYDHENWPQTVKAVDQFALSQYKEVQIIPGTLTDNPQDAYPSWYFYK